MLQTALTRRLGIEHPVIQAGMGSECGARLAAAVSEAGGLGTIGSIGGTPERLRAEIAACRAATRRPFAVNVVTWEWMPFAMSLVDVALEERVPVVTLSFGDPLPALARCRAADVPVVVQVQDAAGARAALAAQPDVLVAQGNEAGGHTGGRGTLGFAVPVAVAGGVGSGRGLAAALAMGAAGVVIGTAFKATPEFEMPDALKQAIVASDGDDTLWNPLPDAACGLAWPHGVFGRVLQNRFTAEWDGRLETLRAEVARRPPLGLFAELQADPERRLNWAGQSAGLVRDVRPAAEVLARVVADAERLLAGVARLRR
jgi:nitronate monooxygenase